MADPNGMVEALEEELAGAEAKGKSDRAEAIKEQLKHWRKKARTSDEPSIETPGPAHEKQLAADPNAADQRPARPALSASTDEWRAYATHPAIALEVEEDAGRDAIVAAYVEKHTPALSASTEEWAVFAKDHGIDPDGKNREQLIAEVGETGWAKKVDPPVGAGSQPQRTTQQNTPQQKRGGK